MEDVQLDQTRNNENHSDSNKDSKRKEAAKDLKDLRGWLMTVAALFVGMAFQSAMQPPAWMPKAEVWSLGLAWKHPRDSALNPDQKKLARRAVYYQFFNATTFSMTLTLMTLLLVMDKSFATRTLWCMKIFFPVLSLVVAANFIIGITDDPTAAAIIASYMLIYATMTVFTIFYAKMLFDILSKRKTTLLAMFSNRPSPHRRRPSSGGLQE